MKKSSKKLSQRERINEKIGSALAKLEQQMQATEPQKIKPCCGGDPIPTMPFEECNYLEDIDKIEELKKYPPKIAYVREDELEEHQKAYLRGSDGKTIELPSQELSVPAKEPFSMPYESKQTNEESPNLQGALAQPLEPALQGLEERIHCYLNGEGVLKIKLNNLKDIEFYSITVKQEAGVPVIYVKTKPNK